MTLRQRRGGGPGLGPAAGKLSPAHAEQAIAVLIVASWRARVSEISRPDESGDDLQRQGGHHGANAHPPPRPSPDNQIPRSDIQPDIPPIVDPVSPKRTLMKRKITLFIFAAAPLAIALVAAGCGSTSGSSYSSRPYGSAVRASAPNGAARVGVANSPLG